MTSETTAAKIGKAVEYVPEWLRQNLVSKDPALRARAEETLGAIITAALNDSE